MLARTQGPVHDAAMSRENCIADATAAFDDGRFHSLLARRVAQRTESDGPADRPSDIAPLAAYLGAELAPSLAPLGFTLSLIHI